MEAMEAERETNERREAELLWAAAKGEPRRVRGLDLEDTLPLAPTPRPLIGAAAAGAGRIPPLKGL